MDNEYFDPLSEWGPKEGAPRLNPQNKWYFEEKFSANDGIAFMNWMLDRIINKKGEIDYPSTMRWWRERDRLNKRMN